MASDLSSGSTEMIEIIDDEKEEGEISLEDVSSSDEGGISHSASSYAVGKARACPNCKSWGECLPWCNMMYYAKNRRDPVKGKENRLYVKEAELIRTKHAASTLRKNDLVPVSSDSDMEIVGLVDTSNRSKGGVKKKKRKKEKSLITIDDLINTSLGSSGAQFHPVKTYHKERSSVHKRSRADREQDDSRSRIISRSPARRCKSPVRNRSPIRSSRSPYNRYTNSKSPIYRSPQRIRSPKRSSPHRNLPVKTARRSSKQDSSLSARSHTDKRNDVTRLLKKVKLESNVNRKKEYHSSLKEKISNMLNKTASNGNKNATDPKEKFKVQSEIIHFEVDDEDDLALLRQKALETKPKKSNKSSDHPADVELEKTSDAKNDDQDDEALNLRIIALQSAVVKKHKDRVQRGVKASKKITRSESPFQSFFDDMPMPSDELLKFASPPCTPSCTPPPDSNHAEDMDLDTDVEREKEKLPYSPTDKITSNVPVDTELLGIEPSDVSFINVNETNLVFDSAVKQSDPISLSIAGSYYDNLHQYGELPQLYAYPSSQHSSETFLSDLSHNESTELVNHVSKDSHNIVCDLDGISYSQEGSYSSTSVVHMPDASHALPVIKGHAVASISLSDIYASPKVQQIEQSIGGALFMNSGITYTDDRCTYDTQTVHRYLADSPATYTSGYSESMTLNESMPPASPLPDIETSQFASPVEEAVSCQVTEGGTLQEPLYMQGVPDVTKDANKIPTLINRTLVPVPLLKSNKQLQQLLPAMKKRETHLEPTFKSAEMQPVDVTVNAAIMSGSNFKPIKLQPVKKPPSVLTTSVPFDNSTNESEENDVSEDKESFALPTNNQETTELGRLDMAPTLAVNNDDSVSTSKKQDRGRSGSFEFRKRVRKKCKSLDIALAEINSCTNNVNKDVNIRSASLERVADRGKSNGMHESFTENGESSILQNVVSIQKPLLLNNIIESKDEERNGAINEKEPKLAMSVKDPEEKNVKSHTLTNPASNNLNSRAFSADEITEDVDRRQSVEEDEDELRAILLASLKRTKSDNVCGISAAPVATSCTPPINTQAAVQQQRSTNLTTNVNTTCSESNNVPLSLKLASLTVAKKVNSTSILSLNGSRKRNSNIAVKTPLKKMPKKMPIPASTKAVNNAKKYQNMMQRKLNLLKLNNAKANVTALKTTLHASDTQRFVISLGSDTDSDSEGEKCKGTSVMDRPEKQQAQDATGVEFEKSLQKFLRDMRKEQEQSASVVKPVSSPQGSKLTTQTNKSSSNMHTPLAVRHLPASQQEEYRRLKQQILEREKLKQQKKVADNSNNINNNKNNNSKLLNNAPGPSLVSPCENKNVTQNQVKLKETKKDFQQSIEIRKKNVTVVPKNTTYTTASNVSCASIGENLTANIIKHTNTIQLPAKGIKKTILNDLNIRITNEIAPNIADKKTVENSDEKQSVNDKQQRRPALRTLSKDELNHKYVKVQLKPDTNGRIVIINDKPASRLDTASVNESDNKSGESHNLSVEIIEEKIKNIEDNSNGSTLSNASTIMLANASTSKQESDDTMEKTMSYSQYEAMRQRDIASNISAPSAPSNNNNIASRPIQSDTNANDKGNADDVWEALKKDVKAELGNLMNLSQTDQEQYLKNTEHKLVTRRYNVLDHLAEMSGNLRQWDMEKDLQNCLTNEVKKLKEQLKIAEERLQMQRERVNGMGPKVSAAREKINAGRYECFKLSRICSTLGNRLSGKNYKLPEAGGQLLCEKLKEVANHTRQFTKKKRIQFSGNFESSSSSFHSSLSQQKSSNLESARVTSVEEDLCKNVQEQTASAMTDVTGSKGHTSHSETNESESLTISELSLDPPQTFASHTTSAKRKENSTSASELFMSDEQSTSNQDSLHSVPKQSSTPIRENDEVRKQKDSSTNISDPATSLELLESSDPSCPADEQHNKKTSPQLSSLTTTTTTTMTMMATMTIAATATTTTIPPYVSMLTHLKMPRNTNPHGVLCPYEIMGICRDEDCEFIHQSRNQT